MLRDFILEAIASIFRGGGRNPKAYPSRWCPDGTSQRDGPSEALWKGSTESLSRRASIADEVPPQVDILFAAVAGVLTAFSPCGAPFLPILWTQQSRRVAGGRGPTAVLGGFLLGVGLFLFPFAAVGTFAAALVQPITGWLVLLSGFLVLGIAVLSWRGIFARANPFAGRIKISKGEPVAVGFAYAMGSVGCTAPLFFAVLLFAVSSAQPALLLTFGVSFLVPLGLLAALAREFGDAFGEALRRHARLLERGSRAFLVGLGAYLIGFFFIAPILGIPL